jgi:hypothetical protein
MKLAAIVINNKNIGSLMSAKVSLLNNPKSEMMYKHTKFDIIKTNSNNFLSSMAKDI